jgi:hypothetical protein
MNKNVNFAITLYDLAILYYNQQRASQLGWLDADMSKAEFIRRAKEKAIQVPKEELEKLLHACIVNEGDTPKKGSLFWHPAGMSARGFINSLIRHDADKSFYFDTYYSLIKEK